MTGQARALRRTVIYNDGVIRTHRRIPAATLRLLVFDLDGTLVDSRVDLANSVNAMLAHLGRTELPLDEIASYVGDGAPMLVRRALGDPDDEELIRRALEYFILHYREHKLDNTFVYEGVLEALRAIRASANGRELAMAVLSNKPVHPSRAIVEALGMGEFMQRVYGGNSFATKKPDPLGLKTLMEEFEVRETETVIVGDSDIDVHTAKNAGVWSVGVSYGFKPHSLEDAPPDVLVDTPEELAQVLAAN